MAPVHDVLYNSDLLRMIVPHVDQSTIAGLRLTCWSFKHVATPHLFRTLVLSTRKRHLRRLRYVAADDELRKSVVEIIVETGNYGMHALYDFYDNDVRAMCKFSGVEVDKDEDVRENSAYVCLHRLRNLRWDEAETMRAASGLENAWSDPLKKLKKLQQVTFTNWYSGVDEDRYFFDR